MPSSPNTRASLPASRSKGLRSCCVAVSRINRISFESISIEALAPFLCPLRIDLGQHHAFAVIGALGDDRAPGIDHHAVSVSAPPAGMRSALRRRNHVGLVLDGAGAQQRFPVRLPGRHGESRRHEEYVALAETAIELGKTHVVANREPEA